MINNATFSVSADKTTLLVERIFPASASQLWQAYADADILRQWFSPRGWVTEVQEHSFEEGGSFIYIMRCVDESQDWFGQTSCGKMEFSNIQPPKSFEYRDVFTDENGVVNEAMPASQTLVTLSEITSSQTMLKVATRYAQSEALQQMLEMGMEEGYGETLEKLENLLKG
ncbi:MAG: SRPBCC domain-containing protein [Fimbriimonadaceae bacterium]|jgi:uncharacterized protein YndB with AHSA1/START domain|nr:SRPBCC domain-containing protein [Fimbriimonadaceae bacterium]